MSKKSVLLSFDGDNYFKNIVCEALKYDSGDVIIHHFPDEEILVKIDAEVKGKSVIFILSTDRPNEKIAQLVFASEMVRERGAVNVDLIAPYLAYMRQDKQFHPGEGISSHYFAKLISRYFDSLTTIDPHLHRTHSLSEIFTIPTRVLHASDPIARWVKQNVVNPILIGPDKESEQWVSEIAKMVDAPFLIVEKKRMSDTVVNATIPEIEKYPDHVPVLVDDIVSTAATMIETINHLKFLGKKSIYGVGIHAVFSGNAYNELLATGITEIAMCNTILHPSNKIDVSGLIVDILEN